MGSRDKNKAAVVLGKFRWGAPSQDKPSDQEKHLAAVNLGKIGGPIGGKMRAKRLSPFERSAIAAHASRIRWATHKKELQK